MSGYQIFYAIALAAAIWWGGPNWRISLACVANFLGTMAMAASPLWVGVLDLATITALLFVGTWRGYAIAAIFATLVPIYVIGGAIMWTDATTYAIVDVLGYSLLGVLASGDGGHRIKRRDLRSGDRSRRYRLANSVAPRNIPERVNAASLALSDQVTTQHSLY